VPWPAPLQCGVPHFDLTRNQVLALIAVTLVLHTAEEYFTFPFVLPTLAQRLPPWVPMPSVDQSVSGLHTALILAAVLPCLVIVWAMISRIHGLFVAGLFIEAVLLVNAIFHSVTAIVAGAYVPGLVTAVLINLPAGIYVFHRAIRQHWIRIRVAWQLTIAAAVLHVVWLGAAAMSVHHHHR